MNGSIRFSRGRTPAREGEGAAPDAARRRRQPSRSVWFRRVAAGAAFVIPVAMAVPVTAQAVAPPGNGFVVTAGDLTFILKQIKIAERHSATFTPTNPCGTLVGPASDQIPDRLTVVRPAHRRRLVQQPVPGRGRPSPPPTSRSRG